MNHYPCDPYTRWNSPVGFLDTRERAYEALWHDPTGEVVPTPRVRVFARLWPEYVLRVHALSVAFSYWLGTVDCGLSLVPVSD